MSNSLAPARARESTVEAEALAWLERHDPGDGHGAVGPDAEDFTKAVVLAAFAAGRSSAPVVGLGRDGVELLREAGETFRSYEALHLAKVPKDYGAATDGSPVAEARIKAAANAEHAKRIEDFLAFEPEKRDVLCLVDALGEIHGLALSVAEDMNSLIEESEGVYGLHLNGDPAPWDELTEGDWLSSFPRLRDALDRFGNPPLPVDPDRPTLAITVNGSEFRTTSRRVYGKIGGCRIEAEWDGVSDLKVNLGPHEPGEPPIIGIGLAPDIVEDLRVAHDGGQGSREQSFGGSGPPPPPAGPCGHYPVGSCYGVGTDEFPINRQPGPGVYGPDQGATS